MPIVGWSSSCVNDAVRTYLYESRTDPYDSSALLNRKAKVMAKTPPISLALRSTRCRSASSLARPRRFSNRRSAMPPINLLVGKKSNTARKSEVPQNHKICPSGDSNGSPSLRPG